MNADMVKEANVFIGGVGSGHLLRRFHSVIVLVSMLRDEVIRLRAELALVTHERDTSFMWTDVELADENTRLQSELEAMRGELHAMRMDTQ